MFRPTRSKTPEPGTIVQIWWADCFSRDAWTPFEELLAIGEYKVVTVGWYIGQSAGNWVVTSGVSENESGTQRHGGSTWFIPAAMISRWENLS